MTHTDSNGAEKRGGYQRGNSLRRRALPQDLQEWLVDLAKRERRSLNAQVVVLLERVREQVERDAPQDHLTSR